MDNKGTRLCIISLLCMFLAPLVVFIIGSNFMSGDIQDKKFFSSAPKEA